MTLLRPQRGAIPSPVPSAVSAPSWEGLRQAQLRFQRCGDCHGITHTPAVLCAHCNSRSLGWETSAGTGAIYSWTVVWRPQMPEFVVPYAPIVVDMDEGWQMLSNLIGCDHEALDVGLGVRVDFHQLNDEITLPYFRPA